ncbi:mechanosensitive ion channel [Massilia sp. R2A-15]|uniref:mechanosensitive ion channel family protein n=1 Tax=Massilia sp. R2A-15 TaxID=3064278 RepID=UPI002732EF90|nr:mechanosensitive ion channel domain-containing protein [Massilia sp. R2A-15]WLI88110.1 mechanosensitive ion channel [Massilia sp. R2A-15]
MHLPKLLSDLFDDLREPGILWQAGAIVLSVAIGWWLARFIRDRYLQRAEGAGAVRRIGVESFARVLGPLLILGLLALSRHVLGLYQHVNLLKVALPLFSSFALIRVAFYLLRRVFARHGQLGAAFQTFEKIFALLVWAAVALYITGLWPDIYRYLDNNQLPIGRHKVSLIDILQACASVVVLLMLALWAGAALEERLMGVQGIHSSLRVVMARLSRAVLIVVAVLVSLSMVGIDLTVLSVFGGALGVGLGLGLQKIASNYVSGFVILLERSLSIGDMITVDKYSGKVSHINTRYTVLQGLDGVDTVLPNEMLISSVVQNQSLSSHSVRVATTLTVAYGSDLDVVIPLLESLPAGVARVLDIPKPGVSLNKFGADGFELELGFWITDPESGRGGVLSDVNKKIYALVQAGDIKLALPGADPRIFDAQMALAREKISQTLTN